MRSGQEPSFAIIRYADKAGIHTATRFACARCTETIDLKISGAPDPEWMAKLVGAKGWKARPFGLSSVRCPDCLNRKSKGESPKETSPMGTTATKPPAAAVPRPATLAEKQKIRAMLDANFDDAAGCYLDGYSDQRIGKELNIPWSLVTTLRETAYGPIRVDPEVQAIKDEIGKVEDRIATVTKEATSLGAVVAQLRIQLANIEKARAA